MKQKIFKLPDNEIPEEIHMKVGMFAKAIMKLPQMTQTELKEKKIKFSEIISF